MGKRSRLHLLVLLILGFSHLISLNAIPLTRTLTLLQEPQNSATSQQTITEEAWDDELINSRMDLESKDYPGSGANNRHTPKPPGGRY